MNDAYKKNYAIEKSEAVPLDLATNQLSEAFGWPLKPRDALCWLTKIQLWFNAGFKTLVKLPDHAIDSKGHRGAMKALYLEGTAWVSPDTLVFYSDKLQQQPIGGDGYRPVALSDVLLSKEEVDSLCARLKAKKYTDPNDSNISQDGDFTVLEKDEVADAEYSMAWRDMELDAKNWFDLIEVAQYNAAMLLCNFNPDDPLDPRAVTNDETCPEDFKRLLRVFDDIAKADPKPRTLSQWLTVAHDRNLKHHSWIDKYQAARLRSEQAIEREDDGDMAAFTEGRVMDVTDPNKDARRGTGSEEKDTTSIKRLKKNALVSKHESHWPTIDDDLRHYDENGLRECAKLEERGFWDETAALKWAEERGRLTDVSETKHATTVLESAVHRMKR